MLCLKKRRTYSFTQGACEDLPRRVKKDNRYNESLNMAVTTLPRKHGTREDRPSRMVLTVTEDTPADMLAGSMDLLVQLPREHQVHTQRVTVQRSTPMMDLLVQIATAHKLAASSYTLQAIGERGLVLPHQPNTPIGALDALQVKLLPKQGTFVPRKTRQANQPFETTFRLQVHLPRNQLYVSRVSPKMNLREILEEVCREKNLDRNKYELRHPANLEEVLDLSLSLQDYHLQEVTLYAKQGRALGSALSSQDIMALQRQEERRRQQSKQGVFGFMFKKSKESSLSTDSLGGRSVSPARSDETGRSASPQPPPPRPLRKRRPAPKPPVLENGEVSHENSKEKIVISHSRNSSDSSGYHEASVLSDNPDSNTRIPETLPRRSKVPGSMDSPRKLAQTSQASKSLGNLAAASGGLSHSVSNTSLSSTGLRKKRTAPAPPPPIARPLSSAISTQGLERIVDSEESLTSDMDISKPPSDIGAASSKANSDIDVHSNANSGVAMNTVNSRSTSIESKTNSKIRIVPDVIPNCVKTSKTDSEIMEKTKPEPKTADKNISKQNLEIVPSPSVPDAMKVATARVEKRGKLVRSSSSLENNLPSYSFISRNSLENVLEVGEGFDMKLNKKQHADIDRLQRQTRVSKFSDENSLKGTRNFDNDLIPGNMSQCGFKSKTTSEYLLSNSANLLQKYNYTKLQKSQSLNCHNNITNRDPACTRTVSLENRKESVSSLESTREKYSPKIPLNFIKKSRHRLTKIPTIANLEGIESDIDSMPECGILESRFSPNRSHADNYICNERCHTRMLKHSLSFQNSQRLKDTKIISSFEKPLLKSSKSFSTKSDAIHSSDNIDKSTYNRAPRLGDLSTTKCYQGMITSSLAEDSYNALNYFDYGKTNLSPPPLSNLQIFAITTKPVDIQVGPMDSIPSEIDELPSLPIINHEDGKSGPDKKLSILEPPPPGLVSRQESNDNWNKFLVQLNSILESRVAGGLTPIPKPRKTSIPESIVKPANTPHALQCSTTQPLPAPRTRSESGTSLDSLPTAQESVNICKSAADASTKSLHTIASSDTRTAPWSNVRKTETEESEVPLDPRETLPKTTRKAAKDIEGKDHLDDKVQVSFGKTEPEELVASHRPINSGRSGHEKFDEKKQESVALGVRDKWTVVTVKSAEGSIKGQEGMKEREERSERKAPKKPRRRTLEITDVNMEKDPEEANNESKKSKPVSQDSAVETEKDNFSQESPSYVEVNKDEMENIVKHLGPGKAIRKTCSMKQLYKKWENYKLQSGGNFLKHAKSMDDIYGICTGKESGYTRKKTSMQTRSCAVISTIPKCEHIAPKKDDDVGKIGKHIFYTDREKSKSKPLEDAFNKKNSFDDGKSIVDYNLEFHPRNESVGHIEDEIGNLKNIETFERIKKMPKRIKIFRSHSDLNNFEINTFGRHPRFLTSHAEDFTGVLNTNLTTNIFESHDNERQDYKDVSNEDSTSNEYGERSIFISDTKLPAFMIHGTHFADWQHIKNFKDGAGGDTAIIGQSGNEDGRMQTDVLLRKVSDTLSGSLIPPSQPSTMPPDSSCSSLSGSDEASNATKINPVATLLNKTTETLEETIESTKKIENAVKSSQAKIKQSNLSPVGTILRASTPNLTLSSSQQDTSDYVSAGGDDLSITDWEYQLPAPPSAFRDNDSPAFNDYETITLGSVEAFKEPIAHIVDHTEAEKKNEKNLTITNKTATKSSAVTGKVKHVEPVVEVTPPTRMENKSFTRQMSTESRGSDASLELKKEVISELENRIETGRLSQSNIKHIETDSRRASEISSTPTLAPVDNTLSNFTITTYSRQKSLNIFDEAEQQEQQQRHSQSDDTTVKNVTTLNRSRNSSENSNGGTQSPRSSTAGERDFAQTKTLPANGYGGSESLEQTEFLKPMSRSLKQESLPRRQSFGNDDEKTSNVCRSKSYISLINNTKVRTETNGVQNSMKSVIHDSVDDHSEPMKKSMSINNLSQDTTRSNEKFSQWRENILKRQEEPTKEKQLQSLQVLKSILPQLKSTQQTDENVIEQSRTKVPDEKITKVVSAIERSTQSSVNSSTVDSKSKAESETHKVKAEEPSGKRFSYAGPPAISLGSWAERPCVNVQIKMDTDYKFGKSNTSGAKTVVNLNGTRDEADYVKFNGDTGSTLPRKIVRSNFNKNEMSTEVKKSEKKENEELAKKLITHTTASGFKRPVLSKIGFPEGKSVLNNEDKPIVTGMELKKTNIDKNDPPKNQKEQEDDDDHIDTRPVKFKELTKAFGQEVTRRAKPKHIVQNRHSDYYGSKQEIISNYIKSDINQNGFGNSNKVAPKQVEPVRNNSVVSNGINSDAQNIPVKKYTSVIGINSQGAHFANQNGNFAIKNHSSSIKISGPMPVVKGFKIQASEIEPKVITAPAKQNGFSVVNGPKKVSQTPQPPTMPVITGVTLKSNNARPKSMPLQMESRDELLESIRNFGGRDKLKNATGRY